MIARNNTPPVRDERGATRLPISTTSSAPRLDRGLDNGTTYAPLDWETKRDADAWFCIAWGARICVALAFVLLVAAGVWAALNRLVT